MILLYLLLAVLAVISVLLLICLVRACIHKKSVPQTPLVRRENPDAMRIAGKLSKMVQVNTVVLPGEDNPHQFDPMDRNLVTTIPQRVPKIPSDGLFGQQPAAKMGKRQFEQRGYSVHGSYGCSRCRRRMEA